jgi:hypothetical protein
MSSLFSPSSKSKDKNLTSLKVPDPLTLKAPDPHQWFIEQNYGM